MTERKTPRTDGGLTPTREQIDDFKRSVEIPAAYTTALCDLAERTEQAERESSERLKALLEAQERVRELEALEKLNRIRKGVDAFEELPADVVKMCKKRGWSMHWTHRGAYLHLEASELIEAIRGKHGEPMKEAADVLLVLMSITEYAGIPWETVLGQARTKCDDLMDKPHYPGEEYSQEALGGKP